MMYGDELSICREAVELRGAARDWGNYDPTQDKQRWRRLADAAVRFALKHPDVVTVTRERDDAEELASSVVSLLDDELQESEAPRDCVRRIIAQRDVLLTEIVRAAESIDRVVGQRDALQAALVKAVEAMDRVRASVGGSEKRRLRIASAKARKVAEP